MRHDLAACLSVAVLAVYGLAAQAAEPVTISNAWARATMPGQPVGAAYLDLHSRVKASLTKVESPLAQSVELHQMSMKNGVMEMRMLDQLPLPADKTVSLAPGGNHLMLFGLRKPLSKGESLPLTLTIQTADGKSIRLEVNAPVRAVAH